VIAVSPSPTLFHRAPRARPAAPRRSLPGWWQLTQRLVALVSLAALLPLFAILYVAVRATSRGPFLFRQQRPGRDGVLFTIYKIRTMTVGSETRTALGVSRSNPEITAVGRLLRELKLDELPQLWNVARGDMAFVGPRPLPAALAAHLGERIPRFRERLEVRPGLSLVSQVCLNDNEVGDRLVADWSRRAVGERHYLRHRSVAYDLLVIAMTALFVARRLRRRVARTAVAPRPARIIRFPKRVVAPRRAA
jgi:lipopolysaccharide/colanic/teichoic acid biosynthesis glycosyltransferase